MNTDTRRANGCVTVPKWLVYVVLALLGINSTATGAFIVSPQARADPFTGTQAREMEKRLANLVKHLEDRQDTHEMQPYHTQGGVMLSAMQAQLSGMQGDIGEIKADVREIRASVNGNGGK